MGARSNGSRYEGRECPELQVFFKREINLLISTFFGVASRRMLTASKVTLWQNKG